jgi:hypothetical protein
LTGVQKNLTQDEIWKLYQTQNPDFDPNGTAATNGAGSSADRGMYIQQFLEYLVAQKKILGFGRINFRDQAEMKAAVYIGLAIITGVALTEAQMEQQFYDGLWDRDPHSPSVGGHCIPLAGYKNTPKPNVVTCITWAKLVDCTQPFITEQMDEAWFVLTQEHVDNPGFRNAFDLKGFADAVYAITGGKVVVPVPPTPGVFKFDRDLYFGITNPDVTQLQIRLSKELAADGQPCYRYKENGQLYFGQYFGVNTRAAVTRYQEKHGIKPAAGYFGAITRAEINR